MNQLTETDVGRSSKVQVHIEKDPKHIFVCVIRTPPPEEYTQNSLRTFIFSEN